MRVCKLPLKLEKENWKCSCLTLGRLNKTGHQINLSIHEFTSYFSEVNKCFNTKYSVFKKGELLKRIQPVHLIQEKEA